MCYLVANFDKVEQTTGPGTLAGHALAGRQPLGDDDKSICCSCRPFVLVLKGGLNGKVFLLV